jgi:hypothetical protein
MAEKYRSWAERRQIISAIIAETDPPRLDRFGLSPSEEVYFRARSLRAVDALARSTSTFKEYYALRTNEPLKLVAFVATLIVLLAALSFGYLFINRHEDTHLYPLLAACGTIGVAALGYWIAAWVAHRNAVRQNTTNIIFARFSQATFADSMHRFHSTFKPDDRITSARLTAMRLGTEDEAKASAAATYLLNYYEFISAGVMRGDLDPQIIRDNIRGVICHYYDVCESHILASNKRNPRVFEHLIKLRTHYREP